MDFLCAYCDTILRLCHYMSNTVLLTMVVMGTLGLEQQTNVAVAGQVLAYVLSQQVGEKKRQKQVQKQHNNPAVTFK